MLTAFSILSQTPKASDVSYNFKKFPLVELHAHTQEGSSALGYFDISADNLKNEQDITDTIYEYLKYRHEKGAIYVELPCSFFPKNTETRPNFNIVHNMLSAVAKGIDKAKVEFGIEARILVVLLRQHGEQSCMRMLEDISPSITFKRNKNYIVGVLLSGDLTPYPSDTFVKQLIDKVYHQWFLGLVLHEQTPMDVLKYVPIFRPARIGCDMSFLSSPAMQQIEQVNIGFEICPSQSNPALTPKPDKTKLRSLPYAFMVQPSTNPDMDEATHLQQQWNLSLEEMKANSKNALQMSFVDNQTKSKLLEYVDFHVALQKLFVGDNSTQKSLTTIDTNFHSVFHKLRNVLLSCKYYKETECFKKMEDFLQNPSVPGLAEIHRLAKRDLPENQALKNFLDVYKYFTNSHIGMMQEDLAAPKKSLGFSL